MQYNPDFIKNRLILSDENKRILQTLSEAYSLQRFRNDARNYEEMTVDFVYTSAKIEGNTYDRIDADNLLRFDIAADGKRHSDAIMLVNLRDGFNHIMRCDSDTCLDVDYLCDLHGILMKDLLPANETGLARTSAVSIGASQYKPLADITRLRTEIKFIFQEAEKYKDPFERAIYLHCNLAYLQYFRDGNKRTSRLMQTAALVKNGLMPLFFSDTLIDKYKDATINYYETGSYAQYASFFRENYHLVATNLLGRDPLASPEGKEAARRDGFSNWTPSR